MATKAITANITGGGALERHLREIDRRLGRGAQVRVGFLGSATYPAEEGRGPLHVAQVAFWQQYGTMRTVNDGKRGEKRVVHVPPRPFFTDMIDRKSPRWGVSLGNLLRRHNYNAEKALALMGEGISDQLRGSIREWQQPPNAPSTVERKGYNAPLKHTKVMLRSVDYQVLWGLEDDND